jgi:hypothetical protein
MMQCNKKKMINLIMMLKFTLVYPPLWKHCSLTWRRQLERVKSFVFVEPLVPRLFVVSDEYTTRSVREQEECSVSLS